MRIVALIFCFLLLLNSCNTPKEPDHAIHKEGHKHKEKSSETTYSPDTKGELAWKGYIDKKIPVFIHYSFQNDLIIGEIIYLKTKAKTPIRLVGDIRDGHFRLVEYSKEGLVTGVIIGNQTSADMFEGSWSNLKDDDLTLELKKSDTTFTIPSIIAEDIYGNYVYDYGTQMSKGDFSIKKISNDKALFNIIYKGMNSVNDIDYIDEDTATLTSNKFVYNIPDNTACTFEAVFYKDLVYIKYTKSECEEKFGMNGPVDAVFIRK